MTAADRRAGIVFLLIVNVCLLLVGCILVTLPAMLIMVTMLMIRATAPFLTMDDADRAPGPGLRPRHQPPPADGAAPMTHATPEETA